MSRKRNFTLLPITDKQNGCTFIRASKKAEGKQKLHELWKRETKVQVGLLLIARMK